jgi:hypothetical protein
MTGIKNFTVVAQSVKNKGDGLIAYVNYLTDKNVPSHKNTEIYPVFDGACDDPDKFLKATLLEITKANKANAGREYSNYAQSFDFVLPKTIKPTPEQWKSITRDILRTVHKELFLQEPEPEPDAETGKIKKNLNFKGSIPTAQQFSGKAFCIIHDQKNPHLNMLIPTVYDGERLQRVDRKRLTNEIKKQFNLSVLNHCKMDYKAYKPENVKLGRRKPRDQYLAEKAAAAAEKAKKELLVKEQQTKTTIQNLIVDAEIDLAVAAGQQQAVLDTIITLGVESLTDKQKALIPAEIEAEKQAISLKKLVEDFKSLADKAVTWITSIIIKADDLDIESNRQEVLTTKRDIELNPLYSDSIEYEVESVIDTFEKEVEDRPEFNPVSKKRRNLKYK